MLCDTCIYKSDECPHLKAWHSALRIISDFTNRTSEDTLEVLSTVAEFSCPYYVEPQQCDSDANESISTEELKKRWNVVLAARQKPVANVRGT